MAKDVRITIIPKNEQFPKGTEGWDWKFQITQLDGDSTTNVKRISKQNYIEIPLFQEIGFYSITAERLGTEDQTLGPVVSEEFYVGDDEYRRLTEEEYGRLEGAKFILSS